MNNAGQAVHLKKEILVRIIKAFLSDDFEKNIRLIPYDMRPLGMEVPYRCCIYKERAIIKDRIVAGLGFEIENYDETASLTHYAKSAKERTKIDDRHLTVLQAACKGCATNRIYVTDLCQGCVARPCISSCRFGAIAVEKGKSVINDAKCKKCQMCVKVCPYKAIVKISVPCEDCCPVNAIKKDERGFADIDFDKCISCGKCIGACPFGAVHEKSRIIDILKAMAESSSGGKKVIALIAPSVAGQFPGNIYQLKAAIIKAGFDDVVEVAQGADITANTEAKEFTERMKSGQKFMTTSCCAGYYQLVKKHIPELKPYVSNTKTPLYYTAELAKKNHPNSVTVFISPCSAKRVECSENINMDFVMSIEELGALFVAKQIEITSCGEMKFECESSKQGRRFGISGAVAQSVKSSLNDESIINPHIINGLNKETIKELKDYAKSGECRNGCNIIEVMCCEGGCIGGNSTINNSKTAQRLIDNLAASSEEITKIE